MASLRVTATRARATAASGDIHSPGAQAQPLRTAANAPLVEGDAGEFAAAAADLPWTSISPDRKRAGISLSLLNRHQESERYPH